VYDETPKTPTKQKSRSARRAPVSVQSPIKQRPNDALLLNGVQLSGHLLARSQSLERPTTVFSNPAQIVSVEFLGKENTPANGAHSKEYQMCVRAFFQHIFRQRSFGSGISEAPFEFVCRKRSRWAFRSKKRTK
jgi:hypothetical protein